MKRLILSILLTILFFGFTVGIPYLIVYSEYSQIIQRIVGYIMGTSTVIMAWMMFYYMLGSKE